MTSHAKPPRLARVGILASLALLTAASTAPAQQQHAAADASISVTAHIVLIDRAEARRVGLRYAQAGGGRIAVEGGNRGRRGGGVALEGDPAGIPASAFIELARQRRLVSTEARAQVTALSGTAAVIASGSGQGGGWGTSRVTGPELLVTPTLLESGEVHLMVRARLRDEVRGRYGQRADASPVDVATTVVARPGEDATVGSMRVSTARRDTGLLSLSDQSGERDILVVLRVAVTPR